MLPATTAPARKLGNPVLVELTRGGRIESIHRGAVAVLAASGEVIAACGDIDSPVFVRSAAKPLQALSLVETGAADAFALGPAELALACGSHGGEPRHVASVAAWLARLGLDERALICGPHPPLDAEAAAALIRANRPATPIHNNCSGKHAGFLAVGRHLGLQLGGYGDAEHPLQVRIRRDIEAMGDLRVSQDMLGTDGCGVPAFALPLRALALAFARFARPAGLDRRRAEAVQRLARAMAAHPVMVAGRGRFDTRVIGASLGRILGKGGAEGVHAAALTDDGIGIAVKIDDGGKRAAEAAMAAVLLAHRPTGPAASALAGYARQTLRNTLGDVIGEVRTVAGWLAG
ncbi:MAG: asparaginase [Rhodospirillales bacterium]|jgi:L-asparaginase II|nr:asparaginase [Rhodospirillales bacterium]